MAHGCEKSCFLNLELLVFALLLFQNGLQIICIIYLFIYFIFGRSGSYTPGTEYHRTRYVPPRSSSQPEHTSSTTTHDRRSSPTHDRRSSPSPGPSRVSRERQGERESGQQAERERKEREQERRQQESQQNFPHLSAALASSDFMERHVVVFF
jgi:hypothetical protein